MKKVMVALFILLSLSLGLADEQEKKEQKVFTDEDLNQYRSPYDSTIKDEKSSSPSKNQDLCSWMHEKFAECKYEGNKYKEIDCIDYWNRRFQQCADDYKYGPPVRVRIVPR